ncbi:MAG: uracil phosphoribosyltransferase [Bacteroidia bacterium]|nr:uracil phosphoribosyltransferase [Bacteroidia bacterium]
MQVTIMSQMNSVLNQYMAELRDVTIQNDSMRFRRNIERMGEIFAYEISKTLSYNTIEVTTPLGHAHANVLAEQPVLATVLRAGLPLHHGMHNVFDKAENAFVSAYRQHQKDGSFDVKVEYMASPDLNNKTLILADPMLATGTSIELTYKALLRRGAPKKIHVVSVIASHEGVEYVKKHLPDSISLWIGAVDDELTVQSYIVPGLGDAGDLSFGIKL